jgi:hypothetical protein
MCLPAVKVGYCWYVCFEIRKPWPFNSCYVTHDSSGLTSEFPISLAGFCSENTNA